MADIDWELWFAYMEFVAPNWSLDVDADTFEMVTAAAGICGMSPGEFVEMAIMDLVLGYPCWEAPCRRPCAFCGDDTDRVELGLQAPFCGSAACVWAASEEQRMGVRR